MAKSPKTVRKKLSKTVRKALARAKKAELVTMDVKSMQRTLPELVYRSVERAPPVAQLFILPDSSSFTKRILRRLREVVRRSVKMNLSGENDEEENPYAPLSPRYKRWKEKHFPNKPILQLTGNTLKKFRMFASIQRKENIKTNRAILVINFDTKIPFYMRFHALGGQKIPKRDWRKMHKWVKDEINKILGIK
jgi:hypothetical protein